MPQNSMKERLSVTVDKELVSTVEKLLESREFRNKSHIVELALSKWLERRE